MNHQVLVATVEQELSSLIRNSLDTIPFNIEYVSDVEAFKREIGRKTTCVVIVDQSILDSGGFEAVFSLSDQANEPSMIVLVAQGQSNKIWHQIQNPTVDVIEIQNVLSALPIRVEQAFYQRCLRRRLQLLEQEENDNSILSSVNSHQHLMRTVSTKAKTNQNLLLLGETGVGKRFFATHFHANSPNRHGPLIWASAGAIRDDKAGWSEKESTLFSQAAQGTVVFQELNRFTQEEQKQLAEAWETLRKPPLSIQLLGTCTLPMDGNIADAGFIPELETLLRSNIVAIPPLRDRPDEVEQLAQMFLRRTVIQLGSPDYPLSPEVLQTLREYSWPGNVRELKIVLDHAAINARNRPILKDDLGGFCRSVSSSVPPPSSPEGSGPTPDVQAPIRLDDVERDHIKRVLALAKYSRSHAAKMLGISRSTLWEKLRRYGLQEQTG